jgi:hypothetical protein
MELSWLMKLRIAAAAAVGIVLIGILAWPLAAPADPLGVVSVLAGGISSSSFIVLAGLAFLSGFIAYFLSWPYGREIGILAVPAGLSIWAVRSGNIAGLIQLKPTLQQRLTLFAALKWEPIFWLAIVAAGFLGVLLAHKIIPRQEKAETQTKSNSNSNTYLNVILALVGSGLIAQLCIRIFAQDVRMGALVSQPAIEQIVFAVLVSFGIAAFVVKMFLNVSYIWPIIASAFVTGFAISLYINQGVLQNLIGRYPAVFFSNSGLSILPVQIVAFGTLGSIAGYWLAVRYGYWRKQELNRSN